MKVLDLFCGCGGFSRGVELGGGEIIAGIDFFERAVETHRKNHPNAFSLCRDLTEYPPEKFEEETKIKEIDMIIGGPPCQGFSMAGRRDKNDPRNSLFMEFVKYINYFKPKCFIMENVFGILTMKNEGGEKVIDIIMNEFAKNYKVSFQKVYAPDFKVPQKRKRVIFFGFLNQSIEFQPLTPKISKSDYVPVKTILEPREIVDKKLFLSERAIEGIKRKKEKSKMEGKGFGAQFLKLEEPSYTIPARYYKDGYDALVKYNDKEIRRLSVQELCLIQTFDFIPLGNRKEQIIQIGNAVPPLLGKEIYNHAVNILNLSQINNEFHFKSEDDKSLLRNGF